MTSRTLAPASSTPVASPASSGTRSRAALLVVVLLALVAGMTALQAAAAPPATAHDVLHKTVPADGAQVQQVPGQVRLVFEEPPLRLGTQVLVTGPQGRAQQGKPVIEGSVVRQPIAPGAPAGAYTVDYRVTSEDGHVVSGSFSFTAAGASAPAAGSSAPATGSTASPAPSSSDAAAASGQGLSWPVPPSIVAWGIVLIVLILAGLAYLAKRLRRHGGDDDEQQ